MLSVLPLHIVSLRFLVCCIVAVVTPIVGICHGFPCWWTLGCPRFLCVAVRSSAAVNLVGQITGYRYIKISLEYRQKPEIGGLCIRCVNT